jgi:uncharacterized protein
MSQALLDAIDAWDADRVADLLAAGEDPNELLDPHEGFPPLQIAVSELEPGGPIDAVVLLLRYGAAVGAWDARRRATPLLTAALVNHIEAVRILLAAGADPNVRDDEGASPLRLCAQNECLEMARLLLRCGAGKTIHESGGSAGMNALGLAAITLNLDMVRLLLAFGADPSVPDTDRWTTLDHLRRFPEFALPETPEKWERFHEIRRLLGGPPLVPEKP